MFLAIDIGNTAIKFGIFDGETLLSKSAIPTKKDYTNEDILLAVGSSLDLPIEFALACSVVPEANEMVGLLVAEKCGVDTIFVDNVVDLGLKVNYEPLSAAGTDRLINSFAAAEKYGVPCVICSFGTATTIDVVTRDRELIGGLIAPGMATMAKALHLNTSRLPDTTIEEPPSIIANNTVDSIRSGVFFGQISMAEGLIARIFDTLGERPTVVATGGFAETVEDRSSVIDIVDENLLLEGLNLLFKRLYTGSGNE
jgi:type III pantothenate kinase